MRRKILYVQYTTPAAYPPLEHSSRILADAGWQVLFLGLGAQGGELLRFPGHANISLRQVTIHAPGWRQKLHYLWFALWVITWTLRWRPAWVYASDPLVCPIALLVSCLPGLRVIYHEHDSPITMDGRSSRGARQRDRQGQWMRFVGWTRRLLARRARLCVLPNKQRAERFAAEIDCVRDVVCVWNCPRRDEVVPPRQPKTDSRLIAYYHGNISRELLPASVLKAMAMLRGQVKLCVVGYEVPGQIGYLNVLQQKARALGIDDCVEFVSTLPRYQLWSLARQCDVGLALMPAGESNLNLRFLIGASNKPFDYLASGLVVLVSDLPDWRTTYVEPGYGLMCAPTDPKSIADALRWLLEHPCEMRSMGERGRRRILEQWNYETQFAPVLATLSEHS